MPRKTKPEPIPWLVTGVPFPAGSPTSWAAAFDKVQAMYGFGDWDECTGEEYWKWRLAQIGIWKRVCGQRKIQPWELYLAALYARERHEQLKNWSWLCGLVPKARSWWLAEMRQEAAQAVETDWLNAVRYEQDNDPEGEWLPVLLRASDKQEVLTRWRQSRVAS